MRPNTDRPTGERSALVDWNRVFQSAKRPALAGCPHMLGRHLLRTARSTQTFPDGGFRPPERRGGRLVVDQAPCVWAPGHPGDHKTGDGRTWS